MTLPAPDTAIRPRYLAEMVRSGSGEASDWHSHDFGQLISASTGSMQIGTENRVLLLSPAMAIWIPPDVRHWMKTSSNNQMLYVCDFPRRTDPGFPSRSDPPLIMVAGSL